MLIDRDMSMPAIGGCHFRELLFRFERQWCIPFFVCGCHRYGLMIHASIKKRHFTVSKDTNGDGQVHLQGTVGPTPG